MSYILPNASLCGPESYLFFYSSPITITEMLLDIPECVVNPTIEELQKSYEFVSFCLYYILLDFFIDAVLNEERQTGRQITNRFFF